MQRFHLCRKSAVALAAILVLASATSPGLAGAARTRPGKASAARPTGTARPGGSATYGHTRRGHSGHSGHYGHLHGYYGYYGYYPAYGVYGWGPPYGAWVHRPSYVPARGSARAPGVVETAVRPRKARVRVDGEFVGQARDFNGRWDRLWLEAGNHDVELSAPGYQTLTVAVRLEPGGYARIEERLQKGEGQDARSTYAPPSPPADTAAAPAAPRRSGARVEHGLLRLDVSPADAAVYLDGEFLARADELSRLHGALPVAVGGHTLEVVRPGYASRRVEVDVSSPDPVRVEIELERTAR